MSQARQLAAILFADIQGYTALMHEDEALASRIRVKFQKETSGIVPLHGGRIVLYSGDGIMCLFNSAVDAVRAAIKIQQQMRQEPTVPLRVGIHSGDVVIEDNNAFGDSVNLASRIESFAVPGSVLVSDKVYQEIKNQPEIHAVSLGKYNLKSVPAPVEIYAISQAGLIIPLKGELQGKGERTASKRWSLIAMLIFLASAALAYFLFLRPDRNDGGLESFDKSIAVLPFTDLTVSGDFEYLGDGLAEEIINSLTAIEELKVSARTSSFQFKGEKVDLREVGKKLQVGIILEGSIQKFEDHFRITAQLIRASDNFHIWSERYDMEQTNIFKIQDDIAASIVNKLQLTLSSLEKKQIVRREVNQQAYNLFLKGLYNYKNRKFAECINFQLQAIAIDSTYAPAYAYIGLSKAWVINLANNRIDSNAVREALYYSERSIQLDPNLAEGYSSIGLISWSMLYDFDRARKNFDKSVELMPSSSLILCRYGYFLDWMGNFEKASELAKRAMRADPVDFNSYAVLFWLNLYSGHLQEAGGNLGELKGLGFNIRALMESEMALNYMNGRFENIVHQCDSLTSRGTELTIQELSYQARALGRLGKHKESDRVLTEIKVQVAAGKDNANYMTALVYAARSNADSCFVYLGKAGKRLEMYFPRLGTEPQFAPFRTDTRYVELYKRYGFDQY